jgi:hypothetical protein
MKILFFLMLFLSMNAYSQKASLCWNEGLCETELFHKNNTFEKMYIGWQMGLKECETNIIQIKESLSPAISDDMGYTKIKMIYEDKCQITEKEYEILYSDAKN